MTFKKGNKFFRFRKSANQANPELNRIIKQIELERSQAVDGKAKPF